MIYGAYGYTGALISEEAAARGLEPVLAGRRADRLAALGDRLGAETRSFGLEDHAALCAGLDGVAAVVHCAGPFSQTAAPMLAACLETGTHYLDITGEPGVIAACAGRDKAACAAGITVLPGAGFDVVPTDCVSAMLAEKMPDATALTLAFAGMAGLSRGTLRTGALFLDQPVFVRRDGRLVAREGAMTTRIDFGEGPREAIAISWGDLESAFHTTGIGSIEVFVLPSPATRRFFAAPAWLRRFLASRYGAWLVRLKLATMRPGPDAEARRRGRALVYGRVENARGTIRELRLVTPEGYALTALTATRLAEAVLAGEIGPGFQTPAGAMGADFILGFDGCKLID